MSTRPPPRVLAFVRAINVGGNRIKMADFAALVEATGCTDVGYYLPTGNLRLRPPREMPAVEVESMLDDAFAAAGLKKTYVMVRTPESVKALFDRQVFAGIDPETDRRCVTFLRATPTVMPLDVFAGHGLTVAYADPTVVCTVMPRDIDFKVGPSDIIERTWKVSSTTRWWNVLEDTYAKLIA